MRCVGLNVWETLVALNFGMGLSQFHPTHFSSKDPQSEKAEAGSQKNIAFLKQTLFGIYRVIKADKIPLPNTVVIPEMQTRSLPTLGEPTLQRVQLQQGEQIEVAELDRLVAERLVAPRQPSAPRPSKMPVINGELVGKRIEAAWNLTYRLAGGGSASGVFWCKGIIEAVSDESTLVDGKNVGLGWIFIAYDDKATIWSLASERWRWDTSKAGSLRFESAVDDEEEENDDDEFQDAVDADDDEHESD